MFDSKLSSISYSRFTRYKCPKNIERDVSFHSSTSVIVTLISEIQIRNSFIFCWRCFWNGLEIEPAASVSCVISHSFIRLTLLFCRWMKNRNPKPTNILWWFFHTLRLTHFTSGFVLVTRQHYINMNRLLPRSTCWRSHKWTCAWTSCDRRTLLIELSWPSKSVFILSMWENQRQILVLDRCHST